MISSFQPFSFFPELNFNLSFLERQTSTTKQINKKKIQVKKTKTPGTMQMVSQIHFTATIFTYHVDLLNSPFLMVNFRPVGTRINAYLFSELC